MSCNLKIQKILAYYWLRILIFIILALAIYIPLSFSGIFLYDGISATLAYLLSSLIIESLRKESKWYAFGIRIDKYFFYYFLVGLIFALIPMLIFIAIKLLLGYEISDISLSNVIDLPSIILLTFVYALSEELLFRGLIFQTLIEKYNHRIVIILFSLFFSLAHIFNSHSSFITIINTFLAGIALSLMYFQTKSLWLPISFHFFWNLFQELLLDSAVSGYYSGNSIIKYNQTRIADYPEIIVGNYYGIEATIFTALFLLIIIVAVLKVKISPYQNAVLLKIKYAESELLYKS